MEQRKNRLFEYVPHWHIHRNVNDIHNAERQGLNDKIAVLITKGFGSMPALYILILWMFGWMALASLGIGWFANDKWPFPFLLFCSNLVQLWALPAIMVGQQVLSRKAEIQADQQFKDVENSYHDTEQIKEHLLRIEAKLGGGNNEPTTKEAAASAITAPFNAVNPGQLQQSQEAGRISSTE